MWPKICPNNRYKRTTGCIGRKQSWSLLKHRESDCLQQSSQIGSRCYVTKGRLRWLQQHSHFGPFCKYFEENTRNFIFRVCFICETTSFQQKITRKWLRSTRTGDWNEQLSNCVPWMAASEPGGFGWLTQTSNFVIFPPSGFWHHGWAQRRGFVVSFSVPEPCVIVCTTMLF